MVCALTLLVGLDFFAPVDVRELPPDADDVPLVDVSESLVDADDVALSDLRDPPVDAEDCRLVDVRELPVSVCARVDDWARVGPDVGEPALPGVARSRAGASAPLRAPDARHSWCSLLLLSRSRWNRLPSRPVGAPPAIGLADAVAPPNAADPAISTPHATKVAAANRARWWAETPGVDS